MTPPGATPTITDYEADGSSVTVSQGSAETTTFLDGFGRVRGTSNAVGVQTVISYDALGRKSFASYPFDGTYGCPTCGDAFAYDALGRLESVTHPPTSGSPSLPSVVQYSYGTGPDAGHVTITDEEGRATTQKWQAFGDPSDPRLASVFDARGVEWFYSYNALGSLTGVDGPQSADRSWTYDAQNRLRFETHPESGTTTYTYDLAGNLTSKRDAANRTVVYEYDDNNRLKKILTPDGVDDVSIEYDDFDNRTEVANGTSSTSFGYTNNRLTSRADTIGGRTFTTTYDYEDGRDNLTKITYPSSRQIIYAYDDANRIHTVKVKPGGGVERDLARAIEYHPSGAIRSYKFVNTTGTEIVTETLTFDERQRPWLLKAEYPGPSYALHLTYGYDRVGNVKSIADPRPDRSSTYTYDALDRLETVSGFGAVAFEYDNAGNRTSKTAGGAAIGYTIEPDTQRLTAIAGGVEAGAYTYDAVGNLTSGPYGDQVFTHNTFDMMRSAQLGAGAPKNVYGYDGDNLRAIKSSDDGVFYYVHGPGSQVLAEYDASSGEPELVREYMYLGGKLLASVGRGAVAEPSLGVRITNPASGESFPNDEPVTLSAEITSAPAGNPVTKVEFYRDGFLIGIDTDAPYSLDWTPNLPAGTYSVVARVVTSSSLSAISAPVAVRVFLVGRVTGITVTPNPFTVGQTATVTVTGNANPCGAVGLDFGDGEAWVKGHGDPLTVTPFSRTHVWTTGGPKVVTATGHGNCRGTVSITVTPIGPTATITSPASGTNYQPPATIPITATASDSGGQAIARVDFYAGGTLIGSDSTDPYQISWANVGLGTYVLSAHAFNVQGLEGISAPVHVSVSNLNTVTPVPSAPIVGEPTKIQVTGVNPCSALMFNFGDGSVVTKPITQLPAESDFHAWSSPGSKTTTVTGQGGCTGTISTTVTVGQNPAPVVTLTSPTNGIVVPSGSTVAMAATATDVNGVASVQFLADGIVRHTDYDSPYSFDWTGVPYGAHSLMARAFDSFGVAGASQAVSVSAQDLQAVSYWPATPVAGRQMGVAVFGASTCGAVQVNYGDGQVVTYTTPPPFSNWHTYANPGSYTVTATGQGTCVGTVSTTIAVAAPPVVAFTWPPEGQTYAAPAEVSMTTSASDPDGSVYGVGYYVNGEPLAWTTTSPYFALQSNVGTGSYALSAVAVDNQGIRTVSAPRTITVGSPAASTVAAVSVLPVPLGVNEGAKVTVSGTNPCTAVQINFGNGDVQTLPIAQLPHTIDYAWNTAGTYTVTATGQGSCSGTASRTFTVSAAPPAPAPEPEMASIPEAISNDPTFEGDLEDAAIGPLELMETAEAPPAIEPAPVPAPQSTVLLIVNLMGTGTGTVVTSPAGISCAGGFGLRCVMNVTPGTVVTLAQAPDAGSTFAGWGGACSGTAACQITVGQQTLVVATFRVPPPIVVQYYHQDALGTVRAVTGDNGALMRQVDYGPFGEGLAGVEQQPVPPIGKQQRFTSKERDVETSLDYFGARYFQASWGRFTSADPLQTLSDNLGDPQRWNRYAHSRNNPLRFTDPDGRCVYPGADCLQYLAGMAKSVGNIVPDLATLINRSVANPLIAPFTDFRFGDAARFDAANEHQRRGMFAGEMMMLMSPLVELGTASTASRISAAESFVASNFTRPLVASDLGIAGSVAELRGTFSLSEGAATVSVDMIRGRIDNPLQIVNSIAAAARQAGASSVRIQGTLANERLYNILRSRYNLRTEGGVDYFVIPLN